MFSRIFSWQNHSEKSAKNNDVPVEPQTQGRENGSTGAQPSGTKGGANQTSEEIPPKI